MLLKIAEALSLDAVRINTSGAKILEKHLKECFVFGASKGGLRLPEGAPPLNIQIKRMCNMIKMIVSGGQTGVDQAALAVAQKFGISIGGWCPKGGLDANGVNILVAYPQLKEATTTNPDERTKLNIENSDGTLIIVPSEPLPPSIVDGTKLTINYAIKANKPQFVLNLSCYSTDMEALLNWIYENNIRILNIGGPRESSWPGINKAATFILNELFMNLDN